MLSWSNAKESFAASSITIRSSSPNLSTAEDKSIFAVLRYSHLNTYPRESFITFILRFEKYSIISKNVFFFKSGVSLKKTATNLYSSAYFAATCKISSSSTSSVIICLQPDAAIATQSIIFFPQRSKFALYLFFERIKITKVSPATQSKLCACSKGFTSCDKKSKLI